MPCIAADRALPIQDALMFWRGDIQSGKGLYVAQQWARDTAVIMH